VLHSQIGLASNARVVMDQITSVSERLGSGFLDTYRVGSNPASVPIATAQVDVVGHWVD
jgi:hypothetical protein